MDSYFLKKAAKKKYQKGTHLYDAHSNSHDF